jgi:hypothetical protein
MGKGYKWRMGKGLNTHTHALAHTHTHKKNLHISKLRCGGFFSLV